MNVFSISFSFQMVKFAIIATVCLILATATTGEPIPRADPDYTEHKVVNSDSKTSSYTDSYSSYPDKGAYVAAPEAYAAYAAAPYPAVRYRSYVAPASYVAPRYVVRAAAPVYDDNVYVTDEYGRTSSVSRASAYRLGYF